MSDATEVWPEDIAWMTKSLRQVHDNGGYDGYSQNQSHCQIADKLEALWRHAVALETALNPLLRWVDETSELDDLGDIGVVPDTVEIRKLLSQVPKEEPCQRT